MCPPGSYFHTLDWHEAHDGQFQLHLQNVQPPSSGIYSATYLEASPLGSAFFRLIVRGEEQKTEVVGGVGGCEPYTYFLGVSGSMRVPRATLVLSSCGQLGEGQLLKTLSSRLWSWTLGARVCQGLPRLPAWRCLS